MIAATGLTLLTMGIFIFIALNSIGHACDWSFPDQAKYESYAILTIIIGLALFIISLLIKALPYLMQHLP